MTGQKLGETWIGPEEDAYPMGSLRWSRRVGDVRWPDGKIRRVKLAVHRPFDGIPASGRIRGRYVSGWVAVYSDGLGNDPRAEYRLYPHDHYANLFETTNGREHR